MRRRRRQRERAQVAVLAGVDDAVDTGEDCDLGAANGGDACTDTCTIPVPPGGCCDAGGTPVGGPVALSLVVVALALGRRRRRV